MELSEAIVEVTGYLYDAIFCMSKGRRGRPKSPPPGSMARFLRDRPRDWPVYEFVRDPIAAEGGKWGSKERAIAAAQDQFGIKERRTVQLKVARMAPWDRAWRESAELISFAAANVDQQITEFGVNLRRIVNDLKQRLAAAEFTPDEVDELQNLSVPLVFQIADDRIKLKRLRAEAGRKKGKRRR